MSMLPADDFESRVREWQSKGITTPPFAPDPAYDEAQRRGVAGFGGNGFTLLLSLLGQLQSKSQPRPDLITPGSTGKLENARPVTFAGRVTYGNETPEQIMKRLPIGELEAGSVAMQPELLQPLMTAMAKVFKPGKAGQETVRQIGNKIFKSKSQIAQIAPKGAVPVVEPHQMWPAAIDLKTGAVAHTQKPGAYQHGELFNALPGAVRGWVDPVSWNAFTDEMLEAATRGFGLK